MFCATVPNQARRALSAVPGSRRLSRLEGRHDLCREALELLEDHRLGRTDRLTDVDDLQAGVLVLDLHELLGDQLGRADQPRARLDCMAERRQVGRARPLAVGGRLDLLGREAWHEAEGGEHLDVLLEERRRLFDALLDAVGDVERVADAEVAAQLGFASSASPRLAEGVDYLVAGPTGRRAAADDALDAVLGHEVQRPRAGADDGLPALDGSRLRAWHQGDLPDLIAPIRHRGRDRVVLALVGEGALVEGLEDDLDLLLEQLAVGVLVEHRPSEAFDLARVIAPPDAEDDATAGQPVD